MFPKQIAVVSDIHIGNGSRSKDLCPYDNDDLIESNFIENFKNFVSDNLIHPDFLIIPGDITHTAQPNEFELASRVISEIGESLNVPPERIVFVPGNHDVDWSVITNDPGDQTGFRHDQRYAPLRNENWIFETIMQNGTRHILDNPHFSIWELDDVLIVGYNSSWNNRPETIPNYGSISEEAIQELTQELSQIEELGTKLKIFLVHHHPIQYSEPFPDFPDFSIMQNSENLLRLLRDNRFDLFIHGHKHYPNINIHTINDGYPLVVLASGSFSARLDIRLDWRINNHFHLINIEGRDETTSSIYGDIQNWRYSYVQGWVECSADSGLFPRFPFGRHFHPVILESSLQNIIEGRLIDRNYIRWPEIYTNNPEYEHVHPELILHVLRNLSERVGFTIHGDLIDDIILLKGGD